MGYFIKDLRIFANRDLKNLVIIDNLAVSFGFQLTNGIPILEWTGDQKDEELLYLSHFLYEASSKENFSEYVSSFLKLNVL